MLKRQFSHFLLEECMRKKGRKTDRQIGRKKEKQRAIVEGV